MIHLQLLDQTIKFSLLLLSLTNGLLKSDTSSSLLDVNSIFFTVHYTRTNFLQKHTSIGVHVKLKFGKFRIMCRFYPMLLVSHSPSTLLFCVVSMTPPNMLWAWCYSHLNINMWRAKNDQSEGTLSLLFPLPFNPKDDDVWRIIHFMGSFISFICLRGQIKLSSIK